MRGHYPIYIEEEIIYDSEGNETKKYTFRVPWKFQLLAKLKERDKRFFLLNKPEEKEEMNEYIRRNKNTLRRAYDGKQQLRQELDNLIEFFSEEQKDGGEIAENLGALLLLTGVLDYKDYQDEIY